MTSPTIIYTHTDEAPALATRSLLPVIRAYAAACGVNVETRDISLAGRILAAASDYVSEDQRVGDALAELGQLAKTPEANIIKLPNISASIPQMRAAIAELQAAGFPIPDYPDEPESDDDRAIKAMYDKVKGSAVNPVLREGNSDRRAPKAVKNFARNNPHSMGAWSADSATHVATMSSGDFRSNEKSVTMAGDDTLVIELVNDDTTQVLHPGVPVLAGEIVDGTFMSKSALTRFLTEQVADAKAKGVLFSLHVKATMMKVSDPIIFGHGVKAFFADVFAKYGDALEAAGANPNDGFGDVLAAVEALDAEVRAEVESAIAEAYANGPDLAMVNSDKGITNLHVPSDVIIDASMPAMIRTSGQMWNADGNQQDTKAVIPESSYAGLYQATIDFCKANGAFDPTTMGTVPNVGLMAKKAEEYGSHDKTFELPTAGTVRVSNQAGETVMEHQVEAGDIWRMCTVKDDAVADWVKLAVTRARATSTPVVFWLDSSRAHDAQLMAKLENYLLDHNTDGLTIEVLDPLKATNYTLDRVAKGQDTISATGNVLRDYLTDLFPILELGTSAKMLSIVPLMNGGGLFETGAGGSAPKHVQQFEQENHLRWDSLGEYLALAVSLEHLADQAGNADARILGDALDVATGRVLEEGKSPSRKVNELDNRGSHFHLAWYWAEALATQDHNPSLADVFKPLAEALGANAETIIAELNGVQGQAMDIGGYYHPDEELAVRAMRPSQTFNQIIDGFTPPSA